MSLLVRCSLGLAGLAGSCCALGIPLSMSVNKDENLEVEGLDKVSVDRGGKEEEGQLISLKPCPSAQVSSLTLIQFGEKTSKPVCGKIEENNNSSITNGESYSKLFQGMGSNAQGNGSSQNNEHGNSSCMKSSRPQGVITAGGEGKEFLGLCSEIGSDQQHGISVEGKNESVVQIKRCSDNCWEEGDAGQTQSLKQYSSHAVQQGEKVDFFTYQ